MRKFLSILLLALSTLLSAQGTEMINNGTFDNGDDWTLGTDWAIDNGSAHYTGSAFQALTQLDGDMITSIEADSTYILTFTSETDNYLEYFIADIQSSSGQAYVTRSTYYNSYHSIQFTAPSNIGSGGLQLSLVYAVYPTGVRIDNVSLKMCAFVGDDPYYVAPDGDDSGEGTIGDPWQTFQKAVTESDAGDTTYFRDGIYYTKGITIIRPYSFAGVTYGNNGTYGNDICYFNYPGENPILDAINHPDYLRPNASGNIYNIILSLNSAEHIHIKGIEFRNALQYEWSDTVHVISGPAAVIDAQRCANLTFENIKNHNHGNKAWYFVSAVWTEEDSATAVDDGWGTPEQNRILFDYDTTRFINCDAYELCDSLLRTAEDVWDGGNNADAFKLENWQGTVVIFDSCRAWNYSDDGWDSNHSGYVFYRNCIAMSSLKFVEFPSFEGNGFKSTGRGSWDLEAFNPPEDTVLKRFTNCIAAFNGGRGFYLDLGIGSNWQNGANSALYNNMAYGNRLGGILNDGNPGTLLTNNIFRNNITIGSLTSSCGQPTDLYIPSPATYRHSNNSWMWYEQGSCSDWAPNDTFDITADDFECGLDSSIIARQLTADRNADFTLVRPDSAFQLVAGSDLIDGGIQVPESDGSNVIIFYRGVSPDLGAFEYIGYVAYQTALVIAGLNFYSTTDSLNTNFTRIYENIDAVANEVEALSAESIPDYSAETMDSTFVGIDRGSVILSKFNTNSTETYANIIAIHAVAETLYGGAIPGYTEHTADVLTANSTTGVTFHIILNRNSNELFEMIHAIVAALDEL